MSFVAFMLKRPYTVISGLILIALLGIGAAVRMPIDIFPEIDVPVVAVVWTYNGMSAQDVQNRILTLHERQLASVVDDIERIEATSYYGVGVEKVFLHQGADVTKAIAQLSSSALLVLKYMPPNITPPLVLRYGATDVGVQLVALYKALGGGWEHYQAVPPMRTPEPAIAAAARESSRLRPVSMDPGLSQYQP